MQTTVWEASAEDVYNKACDADPLYANEARKIAALMSSGFYGPGYVDRFVQKSASQGDSYSPREADSFSRAHALCLSGKVACIQITIGETPNYDADVEGNQAKLDGLPSPFKATFVGGTHTEDGRLEWSEPIQGTLCQLSEDGSRIVQSSVTVKPRSVPLEVGTTTAARTICHLAQDRGIARWPYGSEDIWLYVCLYPYGESAF